MWTARWCTCNHPYSAFRSCLLYVTALSLLMLQLCRVHATAVAFWGSVGKPRCGQDIYREGTRFLDVTLCGYRHWPSIWAWRRVYINAHATDVLAAHLESVHFRLQRYIVAKTPDEHVTRSAAVCSAGPVVISVRNKLTRLESRWTPPILKRLKGLRFLLYSRSRDVLITYSVGRKK